MSRSLPSLLVVLLVATAAGAQFSYRRTLVPGQPLCLMWLSREFRYHQDSAGSLRTPRDTEFAAIDASFDTWQVLSEACSDFNFVRGEDVSRPTVGYVVGSDDNKNIITFRETACPDVVPDEDECYLDEDCSNAYSCWEHGGATIGLTTTTFSFRNGVILDADIELNASQPGGDFGFLFTTVSWPPCDVVSSPDCVATDIQNTVTHEIGHAIGLDHVFEPLSTMEASAPPGETHKRIIDSGSAAGFCDTYPRGLPPIQCTEPVTVSRQLSSQSVGTGCAAAPGALLPGVLLCAWALRSRRRSRR